MDFSLPFPLRSDTYKTGHWKQYPPGTTEVYSYLESRGGEFPATVFFGLQYYLRAYLAGAVVTEADVDVAERFLAGHLQQEGLFNRVGWLHIVRDHGGRLPVEIRAVAEGTVVPTHNVLMTVRNTCARCFWLTNFLESLLEKVWYPTTVATLGQAMKGSIRRYLSRSGESESLAESMLHDFGYRSASSEESAAIGGAAHLVPFRTSETLIANFLLRAHYAEEPAGSQNWIPSTSVVASEHSTMTAWGRDHELDAYRNMLEQYPRGIVSIVSDSFDVYRAAREFFGGALKPLVLERDGILVIRPDSGEPTEVLDGLLAILEEKFGCTENAAGYKRLHPKIKLLWGDGINRHSLDLILQHVTAGGWSAANFIFGMGGALLQKVDRDMMRFAFKCSSVTVNGEEREVFKDPVTDPGKSSKRGKLALVRAEGGGLTTVASGVAEEDLLEVVFRDGKVLRHQSLGAVRRRSGEEHGKGL